MTTLSVSFTDGRHLDVELPRGTKARGWRVPVEVAEAWDAGKVERLVLVDLFAPLDESRVTKIGLKVNWRSAYVRLEQPAEAGLSPRGGSLR